MATRLRPPCLCGSCLTIFDRIRGPGLPMITVTQAKKLPPFHCFTIFTLTMSISRYYSAWRSLQSTIRPIPYQRSFSVTAIKAHAALQQEEKVQLQPNKLNFGQNLNDLWAEYTDRVEKKLEIGDSDFIRLCSRIKKDGSPQNSIRQIQKVLQEIHRRQPSQDTFVRCSNMLIHAFITHGDLQSAKLVVDGMMRAQYSPDTVTVRTILGGITQLGTLSDIHTFYQSLQQRKMWPEEPHLYKSLIWIFANRDDLEGARVYYGAYLNKRFEDDDDAVFNSMIQVYGSVNQPDGALTVYRQMIKNGRTPTPATYHILLSILYKSDMPEQMNKVYADLQQSGAEINGSHLSAMGLSPEQILEEMKRIGITCHVRDYNTFIASYVKENRFQNALDVFHKMIEHGVEPDIYSYSIVLDTLVKDQTQPPEAPFEFYETIKEQGFKPDVVIYTSLISACAKQQDMNRALMILEEMQTFDVKPNIYTFNSILSLLSRKQHIDSDDAERAAVLWDKMEELKVKPDTRSFNMHMSILSRLVRPVEKVNRNVWKTDGRNGVTMSEYAQKMLKLYRSMRRRARPDFASHTIVINTLVASGHLRQAMQVYADAKATGIKLPVSVYNEIMSALDKAKQVSQVLNIWHDMKSAQVLPDNTSYTLALDACEQLGLRESFTTIRAQRKQDIDRLLELDRKQMERMELST
ncbi:hypothetical protein BJV82DRAFT_618510 [Fennellomyces sp. T-0311]|nr:hypothetical protein BJV82DRAFT_618510 [Fennellomyces sp. T-0311]